MAETPTAIEKDRCLCPKCGVDVDQEATQCPKCGERFPAMPDRQTLNTPVSYNLFRWLVLAGAIGLAVTATAILLFDRFVAGQ